MMSLMYGVALEDWYGVALLEDWYGVAVAGMVWQYWKTGIWMWYWKTGIYTCWSQCADAVFLNLRSQM